MTRMSLTTTTTTTNRGVIQESGLSEVVLSEVVRRTATKQGSARWTRVVIHARFVHPHTVDYSCTVDLVNRAVLPSVTYVA